MFYNSGAPVTQPFLDSLEKLQTQFGSDRVSTESDGMDSLLKRPWRGELIHIGKGEEVALPLIGRPVYRFRYLADEIHLVPAALLLADQGIQAPGGRVVDLSMVSQILQTEIREYFATLITAQSA